ncbi:hypothetical protein THICB1_110327 [Thiomonas arsenitoxydans]|uniref:Uncharacterized protein n=1 Tax=Thiomonas arsenitoxydans (strain DSM 22701 / CIP 110005 / 3As) TaxID=426114 RepID=A0ABM9T1Y6_THIA3|nr:hypothetical protein THICB1_110327 [Thiomonas arsenitoxydans]CQR30518.1 hypothetical protein THICB6_150392 [Thiomonas arsenitoxydans]CQR31850.1 hypothetical protein ACO3_30043 [Thiomonas arsenitoxydans]CQR32076.1 hypothetical protein ACO7_30043 [Thiomonas arsenitoxydans]
MRGLNEPVHRAGGAGGVGGVVGLEVVAAEKVDVVGVAVPLGDAKVIVGVGHLAAIGVELHAQRRAGEQIAVAQDPHVAVGHGLVLDKVVAQAVGLDHDAVLAQLHVAGGVDIDIVLSGNFVGDDEQWLEGLGLRGQALQQIQAGRELQRGGGRCCLLRLRRDIPAQCERQHQQSEAREAAGWRGKRHGDQVGGGLMTANRGGSPGQSIDSGRATVPKMPADYRECPQTCRVRVSPPEGDEARGSKLPCGSLDGDESERLASREVDKKTWGGPAFSHEAILPVFSIPFHVRHRPRHPRPGPATLVAGHRPGAPVTA